MVVIACSLLTFALLPMVGMAVPLILVIKLGGRAQRAFERWGARRGRASFAFAGWLSAMMYLVLVSLLLVLGWVTILGMGRIAQFFKS